MRFDGPGNCSVEVIADSIASTGYRVTSLQITAHRFTLAEWNTHKVFNRNSASSRARNVTQELDRYRNSPAFPLEWPCEQPGMSGGAGLQASDLKDAATLWGAVHFMTSSLIERYIADHPDKSQRLHKSLLNRLMEPMQWQTMLITSALWGNFLTQRAHSAAQPEFRIVAELIREALAASQPAPLERGEWHLPYLRGVEERQEIEAAGYDPREISSARCARTSYMTQKGVRDLAEDVRLYGRLVDSNHWSPLAHVATPDSANLQIVDIVDPDTHAILASREVARIGNYPGWQEWRHVVEGRRGYNSYR